MPKDKLVPIYVFEDGAAIGYWEDGKFKPVMSVGGEGAFQRADRYVLGFNIVKCPINLTPQGAG